MKLYDILDEKYLHGEATFGFELEAIDTSNPRARSDFIKHLSGVIHKYFPDSGKPNITMDDSVDSLGEGEPFEWGSHVMSLTPGNIKKVESFLSNLNDNDIKTNSTCGFHVHIKFPNLTDEDRQWIVLNLAHDTNMRNKLVYFEKYQFINYIYASADALDALDIMINSVEDGEPINHELIKDYLTSEKYRILRIHPQGTLEWRGPRDFLNDPKLDEIHRFFILLWKFTTWILETIEKKNLVGIPRSKWMEERTSIEKITDVSNLYDLVKKVKEKPKIIGQITNIKILKNLAHKLGLNIITYVNEKYKQQVIDYFFDALNYKYIIHWCQEHHQPISDDVLYKRILQNDRVLKHYINRHQ